MVKPEIEISIRNLPITISLNESQRYKSDESLLYHQPTEPRHLAIPEYLIRS